jgi:hypothetical protein
MHTSLLRDKGRHEVAGRIAESQQLHRKGTDNRNGLRHFMNISVREALRTRGEEAERVIMKELLDKNVWTPVDWRTLTPQQRGAVIRSSMFLQPESLRS